MNQIQGQCLRQRSPNVPGLQPFPLARHRHLGLRPRLLCDRAFGPGDTLVRKGLRKHHPAAGAHGHTHPVETAR
jgi:hypothetical protein